MRDDMERRETDDRFDRIESRLRQVEILLVILIAVSPIGLFCLGTFAGALGMVDAFWVGVALSIFGVLALCIAIVRARGRKMRQLELDLLEKAMKDHKGDEDRPSA